MYELLECAFKAREPIPDLVMHLSKENSDISSKGEWEKDFEDTIVLVEHVVAYWSRVLQSAKQNYSPTKREALALKEGLIKFQPYLEGEKIFAITDHAAWTLLTLGLVFSVFPNMRIIHRAGKVHSNVDPVSHLRCRLPPQRSPLDNEFDLLRLKPAEDTLHNMFNKLGPKFEENLLTVASQFAKSELQTKNDGISMDVPLMLHGDEKIDIPYVTS